VVIKGGQNWSQKVRANCKADRNLNHGKQKKEKRRGYTQKRRRKRRSVGSGV